MKVMRIAAPLLLVVWGGACDALPRDPENTLERVRGGVLRVGVTEAPPEVLRFGQEASGPEADLVRGFARSMGARVHWRWGPQDEHLRALERFELDLVAAGLAGNTPWAGRVALTRPYRKSGARSHVLAAPPGENEFLVALERHLEAAREGGSAP